MWKLGSVSVVCVCDSLADANNDLHGGTSQRRAALGASFQDEMLKLEKIFTDDAGDYEAVFRNLPAEYGVELDELIKAAPTTAYKFAAGVTEGLFQVNYQDNRFTSQVL